MFLFPEGGMVVETRALSAHMQTRGRNRQKVSRRLFTSPSPVRGGRSRALAG